MFRREKILKTINSIHYTIPDIQRIQNNEVVKDIFFKENKYYLTYNCYSPPGCISIAINEHTGIQYLVDGQHRMAAYKELINQYPDRILNIYVDYYYYNDPTNEDVNEISKLVNICQPHPLTELSVDEYKILDEVEKYMLQNFSKYIKKTKTPHRPNININIFKDKLRESEIIKKLNIKKGFVLINYIKEINTFYGSTTVDQFSEWGVDNIRTIINKIKEEENSFFIGIYSNYEWIERIINSKENMIGYNSLHHFCKTHRIKIPTRIRELVWRSENGNNLDGKCWCCLSDLTYNFFECGHIVSRVMGGSSTIDNLKPICRLCNQDCGTINLIDFKNTIS